MEYVYLKQLPGYCREMVAPNTDGSFTIIINEALSDVEKWEAYCHAMTHIKADHFSDGSADEMEREAHAKETY